MKPRAFGRIKSSVLVLSVTLVIAALTSSVIGTSSVEEGPLQTYGSVYYLPRPGQPADANVTLDVGQVTGQNNLSLGFMLDWHRWKLFVDSSVQKQQAVDANFKLVRIFDFRKTSQWGYPDLMPVTNWNESAKSGAWDWTQVDKITRGILSIGAEPLFCLGWARDPMSDYIPSGMAVDPSTGLPYPESYAAYAKEWARHFKTLGLRVRYYQIMNEPHFYMGWNPSNTVKLGYYVQLWNAAARAMRAEDPSVMISQDNITLKRVFDYWLQYGDDVGFLDFHKYDADIIGQYSDAEMLDRAEQREFETSSTFYGVRDARQKWLNSRGKLLPIINSESNFNSAWDGGTDPKIQQMIGTVWFALVLRKGMLTGLNYNIYFEFSSSKSQQVSRGTGWGFGMTNLDDNKPWYPYYASKMIGSNLAVGDTLVKAESSSSDVRSVAWLHQGTLNVLLVNKVNQTRIVAFRGAGIPLNVSWIDNTIPYDRPGMQTTTLDFGEPFVMNGYSVALFQGKLS